MSRLRRFLHIERSRAPSAGAAPAAAPGARTSGRFSGVERPGASSAGGAAASGAGLERFGPAPAVPPGAGAGSGLELAGTAAGERPFTRCERCGMDHHVVATRCTGCGAPLDTPEQRAFNDRLWVRHREEDARAEQAAAGQRAAREQADAELAARRKAMGEELAREVGESEHRRLGDLGEGRWGGGRIVIPRWLVERGAGKVLLAVIAVAVAALGILALLGRPGPLVVVGAVLLSALLPGRRRRPWWWW